MQRSLRALADEVHDVLVVGGGIYGACVAREAAQRGFSVGLVERGDFGACTSSQSLRVIHGGLRYLQHGAIGRLLESVAERDAWLRTAPHLVTPLPCVMPTRGFGLRGRVALGAALAANAALASTRRARGDASRPPGRARLLDRAETLSVCAGIDGAGVTGGALWWDAQTWSSERLLLAVLRAAMDAGAHLANHVEATALSRRGDRVEGVALRDHETGARFEARARIVVLAAGPFVDVLLGTLGRAAPERHFPLSKALNLVVRRDIGSTAFAVEWHSSFRDRDAWLRAGSRLFFVVPWRGLALVGTKHVPWTGDPRSFSPAEPELARFLAEVNEAWPGARLASEDVVGVLAGMLPRAAGTRADEAVQLAKHGHIIDHRRSDGVGGLVSLVGVKWTTSRREAERAVDRLAERLGRRAVSRSARTPVAGGDIDDADRFLRETRVPALDDATRTRLLHAHGTRYHEVLAHAERSPALGLPLSPGLPVLRAELHHAAAHEMALHLDDVLLRRCELQLHDSFDAGAVRDAAEVVGTVHGWDEARRRAEIERAELALRRFRGPLAGSASAAQPAR